MPTLGPSIVREALEQTGCRLEEAERDAPVRVVLCGAIAGLLNGDLSEARQTLDCDVIAANPAERFDDVARAATLVAEQLGLPTNWLNREAAMYAYLLPLGWRRRLRNVGRFGPLEVVTLGRRDLLALKLMGSQKRPQDLQDLHAMKPTRAELEFLLRYLDQRESESLDRESFDWPRTVIEELRQSR